MQATILLDVYNFLDLAVQTEIVTSLEDLIKQAASVDIDYVDLRLYGGWFEDGLLTVHASKLVADIVGIRFPMQHPKGHRLLRGRIGLATGPAALSGRQYGGTLTSRSGLKAIRLMDDKQPDGCASEENCAVRALKRLTKRSTSRCPTALCEVQNKDAFRHKEQKMVDTMMAIDTLHLAASFPQQRVIVASDDVDLVPALEVAANSGGDVSLISRRVPDLHGVDFLCTHSQWTGYSRG